MTATAANTPTATAVGPERAKLIEQLTNDNEALASDVADAEQAVDNFSKVVVLIGARPKVVEFVVDDVTVKSDPWLDHLHTPGNELALATYQALKQRVVLRQGAKQQNEEVLRLLEAMPE